ncbi:MAG: murein L,D-transpeptidase catalytic domain family protein [Cytophagaceae bacterium]|nr:murein L,D-transpeptidase catalytic domain family protein [Cytophagaceae bacterium]
MVFRICPLTYPKIVLNKKDKILKIVRNFIIVFVFVVHIVLLSFTFSSDKSLTRQNSLIASEDNSSGQPTKDSVEVQFENHVKCLYNQCGLSESDLSFDVFKSGLIGYYNLRGNGSLASRKIISLIDFQKTSTEKRLWIIDLDKKKVLYHSLVAHGKNTGVNAAIKFSDQPNSLMSSLGFYVTENTYQGKHGLSLVLEGMDQGFNSNAKERCVVIHSAEYVSESFIKCNGRLGRSHGCPALPVDSHREIINLIKGGTLLYIHYPIKNYKSQYLNKENALKEYLKETVNKS